MMRKVALLFLTVFLIAVNPAKAQDDKKDLSKMEEVMHAHDLIMDKMPELAKLIDKLETKADSVSEKKKYRNAVKDLKAANTSMMNWMVNFGHRFEADEMYKGKQLSEQKKIWILEEQKNVEVLREEIILSIRQGKRLLNL